MRRRPTLRFSSSVEAAEQVYCGDTAQRLGLRAQRRRIGARARYQADAQSDFRKRVLGAERAECIGGGKNYLRIRPPRLETGKELGHIAAEQITTAFHDQRIGPQTEAVVERIAEELADPLAACRIGARQAEIDAVESPRRPESR